MIWDGSLLAPEARLQGVAEPLRTARRSVSISLQDWYRWRYRKTWKCRARVTGGFSYGTTVGFTRRTRVLSLQPAFILNPPRTLAVAEPQPDGTWKEVRSAPEDPRRSRIRYGSIYADQEGHVAYFTLKLRVENVVYYRGTSEGAAENRPKLLPHVTNPMFTSGNPNDPSGWYHFISVDVTMPAFFSLSFPMQTVSRNRVGSNIALQASYKEASGSRILPAALFGGSPYVCTWQGDAPADNSRPSASRVSSRLSLGNQQMSAGILYRESEIFFPYQSLFDSVAFSNILGRPFPFGTTESDLSVEVTWEEDQDRDL
jgi:hypothetical protein